MFRRLSNRRRNVVNVILVDFRALDTFGEITVVAVAGLAAFALIRPGRARAFGAAGSLILRTASRFLVSLILVFSVLLLLRGHDAPDDGGFIGGLIAAIAFVLYSIAHGPGEVLRTLRTSPRSVALAGIGLALLAGMAAALPASRSSAVCGRRSAGHRFRAPRWHAALRR